MPTSIEQWRERQLDVLQRMQVIDALEKQQLLDEYQHRDVIERMDAQSAILADTNLHARWIEGDIARLLATTDKHLPAVVDRLTQACGTLGDIARMIASPRKTEAQELFESGTHALTSAAEMARKGSAGLADELLDDAVRDLERAIGIFRQAPEFWFNLGLAYQNRGPSYKAVDAFDKSALYAIAAGWPEWAAEAVLVAAMALRDIGDSGGARNLLHKYLPPLGKCAEIYLSLGVHDSETIYLHAAFEIAPELAMDVAAKIDLLKADAGSPVMPAASRQAAGQAADRLDEAAEAAAAEVCRSDDGPVGRLNRLEAAVQAVIDQAAERQLEFTAEGFTPQPLPADLGIEALLRAEARIQPAAAQASAIMASVLAGLEKLELAARALLDKANQAKTTSLHIIQKGKEEGDRGKESARQAVHIAGHDLRRASARAAVARRVLSAYDAICQDRQSWAWAQERARDLTSAASTNDRSFSGMLLAVEGGIPSSPQPVDDANLIIGWRISEERRRISRTGAAPVWPQMITVLEKWLRPPALPIPVGYRDEILEGIEHAELTVEIAALRVRKAHETLDSVLAAVEGKQRELEEQAEAVIQAAETKHATAREVTDRVREVLAGPLATLEAAIAAATAPRERVRPSAKAAAPV